MRLPMTASAVVKFVTATSLFGMALGGGFGFLAAWLSPEFFVHFVSWTAFPHPVGLAVLLGAFGGVLCGGCLGGFAIAVDLIGRRLAAKGEAGALGHE